MSIYQFINFIYVTYSVTMRKEKNAIKIEYKDDLSNNVRRAIGEEISDFLKENKEYTFEPHLNCFDNWRYNKVK